MIQDCLRIYDQMMQDFVGSFSVSGKGVLTVLSTPDRPFSPVDPQLDEEFRSQMMESNLIVDIVRQAEQYNPKLRVDFPFVPLTTVIDNDFVLGSNYPRPYIIPYQIDTRSRTKTDMNLWYQWIHFLFNPYYCLYPDFGDLWGGPKQIQLILRQIMDTSDQESGESERWYRKTAIVEVMNGWMFPIPEDLSDIPDVFGMIKMYKVVKDVQADVFIVDKVPTVLDPSTPGVLKDKTIEVRELDSNAVLALESK